MQLVVNDTPVLVTRGDPSGFEDVTNDRTAAGSLVATLVDLDAASSDPLGVGQSVAVEYSLPYVYAPIQDSYPLVVGDPLQVPVTLAPGEYVFATEVFDPENLLALTLDARHLTEGRRSPTRRSSGRWWTQRRSSGSRSRAPRPAGTCSRSRSTPSRGPIAAAGTPTSPACTAGRSSGRPDVRSRRAIAAILASLALLLGISAYMAWNLSYGPDESSHVFMVDHHAGSLDPLTREEMSMGALRGHPYFLLSPVPYVVHIPFQWIQEAVGPVEGAAKPAFVITRFGGLLIAVAQFALTIAVVRRLFRGGTPLQVIMIATAANLLPQLRYLHAYVNPDALTIVAGTACFAVALRVLQRLPRSASPTPLSWAAPSRSRRSCGSTSR